MRGLLHRIASDDPAKPLDPVDSILAHLRAILNTERGDGFSHPELGVALHELLVRWPTSRLELLQELRQTIETFEPRLSDVEIDTIPGDPHRLAVLIKAKFVEEDVQIRTDLAPVGQVSVTRYARSQD